MGGPFSVLIAGGGCTGVAYLGFSGIRLCRKNGTKSDPPVKAARVSVGRRGNSGIGHRTGPDASARWISPISAGLLASGPACAPFQAGC